RQPADGDGVLQEDRIARLVSGARRVGRQVALEHAGACDQARREDRARHRSVPVRAERRHDRHDPRGAVLRRGGDDAAEGAALGHHRRGDDARRAGSARAGGARHAGRSDHHRRRPVARHQGAARHQAGDEGRDRLPQRAEVVSGFSRPSTKLRTALRLSKGRTVAIVAVLSAVTPLSAGQDKRTYYTVQHPDQFAINWGAFYDKAEAMTDETRRRVPNHLDLAYGKDPKQRLDVYEAARGSASREGGAVFIFLHGGGFREGDRRQYGYVAGALAPKGIVTVVPSYRLLPEHYPAQAHDTEAVVAWVHANISRFGGSPARIYVGGHSAGAIMSTFAALKRDWMGQRHLPADVIKGVVAVS